MRRGKAVLCVLMLGIVAGFAGDGTRADAVTRAAGACSPARVQYAPHPRVDRQLGRLPWIGGKPFRVGLIGLLWYWPSEWREQRIRTARIFTGGKAPDGYSTKILWTFVPRSGWAAGGSRLVVRGTRLDTVGSFSQEFGGISFSGQRGPAYASIVDVPEPGCWRLELSTGAIRASVVVLAVSPTP